MIISFTKSVLQGTNFNDFCIHFLTYTNFPQFAEDGEKLTFQTIIIMASLLF